MRKRWRTLMGYLGLAIILIYLFGLKQTIDENFVEINTCPACYGQSECNIMFNDKDKEMMEIISYSKWKFMKYLNVKNVYYASIGGNQFVLKKLAHDWELVEFNEKLCNASRLPPNCNVSQAMKIVLANTNDDITQVIKQHTELFKDSDALRCHHDRNILHLYENYLKNYEGQPYLKHHFISLLAVNMEPLVMKSFHSKWFPKIIGACGRIMIEDFVGPTLTQLANSPWIVRANYAWQLLKIAHEFSEGEFHLYLTDVSLDNFAVDDDGSVKIIDAENIVIVDSSESGLDNNEHVNDGFGCVDCLSFSFEDLCNHKYADHNYFAICKGILSSTSFSQDIPEGLLHNPPGWVIENYPSLMSLIEECAYHPLDVHINDKPRRKEAAVALQTILASLIDENNPDR